MLGYTEQLRIKISEADTSKRGVRLGVICVSAGYAVAEVAEYLGVSRMVVYNWFTGASEPTKRMRPGVEALAAKLLARFPTAG